jgi:hypothetical protein
MMRLASKFRAASLVAGVLAVMAILPATASAHTGTITISCTSVEFSYTNFGPSPTGGTATEQISVDGTPVVTNRVFTFSGSSATDTVTITPGSGTHTISASTQWKSNDGETGQASQSQEVDCGPPPCTVSKANFRWHYSANGSSGSWSATTTQSCPGSFSMGPQSMEGDLKVSPGTTLLAGYDFTVPGNNGQQTLTVNNPQVTFIVHCVSGATPSSPTFTVSMPTQTYTFSGNGWIPSGDQHSSLVYQGSISVPDLCGGGKLRLDKGGTFSASLS